MIGLKKDFRPLWGIFFLKQNAGKEGVGCVIPHRGQDLELFCFIAATCSCKWYFLNFSGVASQTLIPTSDVNHLGHEEIQFYE